MAQPHAVRTRSSAILLAALLAAPVGLTTVHISAASAQTAPATRVDPYVVILTEAQVPIRSGGSTIFYPIAYPKAGDALVVDGETTGWLRIMYPSGVRALVSAEDAAESAPGKVRLNKASKLRAPHANSGVKGAYLGVQETELPIGTEFAVVETFKDDTGTVTFWSVQPPPGARGWISREAVRRATEAEAAPIMAKLSGVPVANPGAPVSVPVGDRPGPASTPVTPDAASPTAPPASAPSAGSPASNVPTGDRPIPADTPAAGNQLAPSLPAAAPAAAPVAPPAVISTVTPPPPQPETTPAKPVATPPGMEIPATVPVGDKDGGGGAAVRTSPQLATTNLDSLKALYDRVRAQPAPVAELDQAIAEFERFKGGLSGTPRDQALAKQLDAYIQAMKLRKEIRDLQNANAQINRDTELMKSEVGKQVVELEKQRIYNVIGRLVRSTVYDGGRAPVLYRVMSPEPGSARTLGYLLPDPGFDYANKLDQVVGIIGDVKPDESLRTNLIVPKRVDVVSLAPIVASPDIPGLVVPRGAAAPAAPKPAAEPSKPAPTPVPPVAPPAPAPAGEPEKP